ncbi:MAG TPA: DNA primase [Candidatus Marinimicrobia bacterium]|jgi:DNA primase|nr:DNA primase [Candidatus Neomarinimicrobiota bacterium]MDP6261755.1 DNA primase [Candidatus Neomarinimicrobiota bacterium]MDP7128371.1 DNA primase [Candidatus Neomarinimicrobiota bacterium]MDP7336544.1 DNA primase [Candidatus Neomarinimicrobiota bacterium]MDP7475558.1 DNA primase [Candidatus Neomarinimicrobiota bacterium]|tara:strand:+ start:459 stop:2219 length:1761 start_codon:yes stop_codon:yes gene_type:complete
MMARVSQEIIERVRDASNILDVVSKYVDLKKRGQNYFGLCPFHNEKTPSFSVAPAKEIFHCFGCGTGGSTIDFIMEYEKIGFVEAVQRLGEQYGIEVQLTQAKGGKELFSNLYELHEMAMTLYHKNLYSEKGKSVLSYLSDRGLEKEILEQFKIGLAYETWDELLTLAKKKKMSNETLEKTGLFLKTEKGTFDRFRNRIMFPIFNTAGRVIAFGGRALDPEDPAKYLNSPETPLYRKRDFFYGLHSARQPIREHGYAIFVEGYMDFLQLFQAGIQNVIALSGTALTERHALQIRKFTHRAVLAYDGDSAGIDASVRAGYLLLRFGIEPQVVHIPDGMDPDDWVRKSGADELKEAVDKAVPVLPFHIQTKDAKSLPSVQRSEFIRDVMSQIAGVSDRIIRDDLLKSLAQEMRVEESDLLKNMNSQKQRNLKGPIPASSRESDEIRMTSKIQKAQVELVKILAGEDLDARQIVRKKVHLELFSEPVLKKLAKLVIPIYDEIDYPAIVDQFDSDAERKLVTNILMDGIDGSNLTSLVQDCIRTLEAHPIKENIREMRIRIRELEEAGGDPTEAIIEVAKLQEELKSIFI